jgi:nucleotide-binding universal stress UspA family protein
MEPTTLRRPTPAAIQLKKILVPVDFSGPSRKALHYARRLAQFFGSEVTLLNVVQKIPVASSPEVPPYLEYAAESFDDAEKNLQALCATERAAGLTEICTVVRTGLAADRRADANSDLIVIATQLHRLETLSALAARPSAWRERHPALSL